MLREHSTPTPTPDYIMRHPQWGPLKSITLIPGYPFISFTSMVLCPHFRKQNHYSFVCPSLRFNFVPSLVSFFSITSTLNPSVTHCPPYTSPRSTPTSFLTHTTVIVPNPCSHPSPLQPFPGHYQNNLLKK